MSRYKQGRVLISRHLNDHRELYYPLQLPLLPLSCPSLLSFFQETLDHVTHLFFEIFRVQVYSHHRSAILRAGGGIDAASNDWRTGIEHESHAHACAHARGSASVCFFSPIYIYIISVFRKFGRVAQHRSQFGFSHLPRARRCFDSRWRCRFVGSICDSRWDTRRSRSRETTRERETEGEKRARESPSLRQLRDVSEIATFCGTILSWRIVARCPYDTMTDVPLRHG